ncbi:hypothetical protein FA13DRAFT_1740166 [Coprinellus micaceus]|uniref:Uncharacterized protein n=1 Tax=Coprinellus micaceus TaxID=71717 RepID=A0A4Y7SMX3_COPMI|nr:hypothetical protein FA13DRAFT_1740166 [Coprinellus micaceus]
MHDEYLRRGESGRKSSEQVHLLFQRVRDTSHHSTSSATHTSPLYYQMDSFTSILSLVSNVADDVPTVNIPSDEENKTAQGGGTYCTIA